MHVMPVTQDRPIVKSQYFYNQRHKKFFMSSDMIGHHVIGKEAKVFSDIGKIMDGAIPLNMPELTDLKLGCPLETGDFWLLMKGEKSPTIGRWNGRHAKIMNDYQRHFCLSIYGHAPISFRTHDGPIGRVQRTRQAGYHLPPSTRCVTRETRFGNPITLDSIYASGPAVMTEREAHETGVNLFRDWLNEPAQADLVAEAKRTLSLYDNLACWCRLDYPCHVDVWLEILNEKS